MPRQSEFERRIEAIDELVQRLETAADPATRAAAQELVRALMELHGAALERMLAIVRRNGEAGRHDRRPARRATSWSRACCCSTTSTRSISRPGCAARWRRPGRTSSPTAATSSWWASTSGRGAAPDAGQLPRLPVVGDDAQARHRAGDPRGGARRDRDRGGGPDRRGRQPREPGARRRSGSTGGTGARDCGTRGSDVPELAELARGRHPPDGARWPRGAVLPGWRTASTPTAPAARPATRISATADARGPHRSPVPAAARPTTSCRPAARPVDPTCTSSPFPSSPATDAPRWPCRRRGCGRAGRDDAARRTMRAAAASSSCGGSPRRGRRSSAAICAGRELGAEHDHLIEPAERRLACACGACAVLFSAQAGTKYKRVPRDVRALDELTISDAQWEALRLPDRSGVLLPQHAAGPGRGLLPEPGRAPPSRCWSSRPGRRSGREHPVLARPAARRPGAAGESGAPGRGAGAVCFLVPIDQCFRLVGIIRMHWKGFTGGTRRVGGDRPVLRRSRPASPDRRGRRSRA